MNEKKPLPPMEGKWMPEFQAKIDAVYRFLNKEETAEDLILMIKEPELFQRLARNIGNNFANKRNL